MQRKGAQGAHGGALLRELLNVGLQGPGEAEERQRVGGYWGQRDTPSRTGRKRGTASLLGLKEVKISQLELLHETAKLKHKDTGSGLVV